MYIQAHNVAEPFGTPYYPRHSAFSLFFWFQSVLQVFWLRRLFLSGKLLQEPRLWTLADADDTIDLPREVVADSSQVKYTPCYILGNITLASVSFFWLHEMFVPAQLLCIWSLAIQLYGVFVLLDASGPHSLSTRNWLTHLVAKTASGLGFLYVWKGWGTIDCLSVHPRFHRFALSFSLVKIQGTAQQCQHIHNVQNNRIYTFNVLEAELRENWTEGRGPLVVIAHYSKWTKLPLVGHSLDTLLLRPRQFRYATRTFLQTPRELMKIIGNSLSAVNIDVSRCDITFGRFHLKDSVLVEQGSVLIRHKYQKSKNHGVLSDACLDSFIEALFSVYERTQEC
ncbi:hypothetical protein AN958_10908 [Leucoagaricus sp. SymC.cos]|nr:hypothetical protein AN958_10908 [Leucoagaricus sp. SymC.cos]